MSLIRSLRFKFLNQRILQSKFYNICHLFKFKKLPKDLLNNGYVVLEESFPLEKINLEKYLQYENFNFVSHGKKVEFDDLKKIYKILHQLGVLSIVKRYLGSKIYCYDNSIKTLGILKSNDRSWQPHHDSKGRRIKIYIWINKKDHNTHPLYYLKKTHKNLINWKSYEETRFPDLNINRFDKIYGNKGDIIIFDTHGIHSHFKTTTVPRSVIELTFEPFGVMNRLNKKNIKTETSRLSLIDLDHFLQN